MIESRTNPFRAIATHPQMPRIFKFIPGIQMFPEHNLPPGCFFLPILCGEGYTMLVWYSHWKFLSFRFLLKHIVLELPLFFLDNGLLKRIQNQVK